MKLDPRLLRLLDKSKLAFSITIALGISGGVLAIAQAWYFTRIVNCVFLEQQGFHQAIPLLLTLLILILIRALVAWGYEVSGSAIAKPIKCFLRVSLYQRIIDKGPMFLNQESTGELVNTAIEGVEALDKYFSQYIPQIVLAGIIPLIYLIFIVPVDWVSGLVMLLTAPLIPIFMALIGNKAQDLTRRQWISLSRMSAYFLDVLQGLPTLKSLGRSREQVGIIFRVSQQYTQTTMSVLRIAFLSAMTLELVATLSTAVVAVQLGLRLLYGWISFEQALFILALAPEYYLPLRMLGIRFHAGMAGVEAGKRIFQWLDEENSNPKESRSNRLASEKSNTRITQGQVRRHLLPLSVDQIRENWKSLPTIYFKDVRFDYEPGKAAIDGVNLLIQPGENIALVGPSGAGKSTLTALLMGFLQPVRGAIYVGEINLSQIPIESWRDYIAWVPQKPYLFYNSIAANIRLANPEANQDEVIEAARFAHADEFIRALPQDYDTMIGERGVRLSAGQAQRIALARAFLKDAPLLMLDEGTAHLDSDTASHVQESIQQLASGRTVIIIAHRLTTVMQADRIVVLDKGKIVQEGTHAQLAKQEGLYRKLLESDFYQFSKSNAAVGDDVLTVDSLQTQVTNPQLNFDIDFGHKTESQFLEESRLPTSTAYSSPLTLLVRLLRLIFPYWGWIALSVLLGFATVASSVGLSATSAYIISAAALQPSIAVLQVAIVGVRFFGLSRGVFRYLERYVSHKVTLTILGKLRVWFYEALEPLAPARLIFRHSGDLLSRIIGDIASLENFYIRALYPPLVAILTAGLLGVYLGMYSSRLAAVILIIFLAACTIIPWLLHQFGRKPGKLLNEKRSELSAKLVEGIQGLADLLIYGQGRNQMVRIDDASRSLEMSHQRMASLNGFQTGLIGLISHMSLWVVLWLAIPLVEANLLPGVYMAGLALATLAAFEAVTPLPLAGQYLGSNLSAASRLFELVDTQPEVIDPPSPLVVPQTFDLDVMHLSFRYPGSASSVIHDISFSLPQGKHIGIVGRSGAGKTTLIHLLLRYWEYEQGSILLNGSELRSYNSDDLRKHMAVVSQNTHLFNATLRENLLLAQADASDERILEVINQAQLDEVVKTLPEGLNTWLGEQGVILSAGERQRVAIARALLKDAPIMILDEATANLDAITERKVLDALEKAVKGKSLIMVSHGRNGMEGLDEVIELG